MKIGWDGVLNKLGDCLWEIPQDYKQGMRTSGLIYASEAMIGDIVRDQAPEQVANVAFLPGIVDHSLAMPDIHWGYGFAIGGVAAMRMDDGGPSRAAQIAKQLRPLPGSWKPTPCSVAKGSLIQRPISMLRQSKNL